MIKINLLSPVDKLNIKWKKINNSIASDFAVVIFIQIIFIFILLLTTVYLNVENKKLNKQLDNIQLKSETKEIKYIEEETIKHNSQINSFLEIQKNQPHWVKIFENFSQIVPSGIRIKNISIKPKNDVVLLKNKTEEILSQENDGDFEIIIVGVSETIENLLSFEKNLSDSEVFIDFNIEPKNYDSENFRYVLTIERENVISN